MSWHNTLKEGDWVKTPHGNGRFTKHKHGLVGVDVVNFTHCWISPVDVAPIDGEPDNFSCMTITEELTDILEAIGRDLDMSGQAVARQAIAHYQLVHKRIKDGEVMSFSGDKERLREFADVMKPLLRPSNVFEMFDPPVPVEMHGTNDIAPGTDPKEAVAKTWENFKTKTNISHIRAQPWIIVSDWFGMPIAKLSVPGTKDGKQTITVQFDNGTTVEVTSETTEGAWKALREHASEVNPQRNEYFKNKRLLAAAMEPELWSDNEIAAHVAASPLTVAGARERSLDAAARILQNMKDITNGNSPSPA
jgi:hypothetical protein